MRIGVLAMSLAALGTGSLTADAFAKGNDSHDSAQQGNSNHQASTTTNAGQSKNTGQASRPDSGGNRGEQQGDMHGVKAGESHSNDDHTKNTPQSQPEQHEASAPKEQHAEQPKVEGHQDVDVHENKPADENKHVDVQVAGVTTIGHGNSENAPGCAFGAGGRKPVNPPHGGVEGQTQTAPGCDKERVETETAGVTVTCNGTVVTDEDMDEMHRKHDSDKGVDDAAANCVTPPNVVPNFTCPSGTVAAVMDDNLVCVSNTTITTTQPAVSCPADFTLETVNGDQVCVSNTVVTTTPTTFTCDTSSNQVVMLNGQLACVPLLSATTNTCPSGTVQAVMLDNQLVCLTNATPQVITTGGGSIVVQESPANITIQEAAPNVTTVPAPTTQTAGVSIEAPASTPPTSETAGVTTEAPAAPTSEVAGATIPGLPRTGGGLGLLEDGLIGLGLGAGPLTALGLYLRKKVFR